MIGACAALLATACTQKQEPFAPGAQQLTIRACQEGSEGTRTLVQDGGTQVLWEPADEIKVFRGASSGKFVSQNTSPVAVAEFQGGSLSGTGLLWGLYPYRSDAASDGVSVTTTLPAVQTARAGSFARDSHLTLACATGPDLTFYNVCGGVRFSLTQAGIRRVTFRGNAGETLAGRIKLVFAGGVPVVQEVSEAETLLILSAPDGGTFETEEWYYLEALPGTLSRGYTMTFYKENEHAELSSSGPVTFRRGIFGSLAEADETVIFKPNGVAVDMGLSVKWASCNVGASAPEDYGDYFAWGETTTKSTYDGSTYKYCKGYSTFTKYCSDSSSGYNGYTDNKTVLDLADDAAHVNWGGSWRMPTDAEWTELLNTDNCTWTWTTQNGVNGYKVTSKKTGNSIFLPAAGYYRRDSSLLYAGSRGYYWSSSLSTDDPRSAYSVYFYSSGVNGSNGNRGYGQSVRAVTE